MNWFMVTCQGSTRYWNYLEDYWPCAGGLSAVNAIGTQLRDPLNSSSTYSRRILEYAMSSTRLNTTFLHLKTAIRHRVSPEYNGSRNCVPMAFTAESPPAQGQ